MVFKDFVIDELNANLFLSYFVKSPVSVSSIAILSTSLLNLAPNVKFPTFDDVEIVFGAIKYSASTYFNAGFVFLFKFNHVRRLLFFFIMIL